jgi:hypothetical protein
MVSRANMVNKELPFNYQKSLNSALGMVCEIQALRNENAELEERLKNAIELPPGNPVLNSKIGGFCETVKTDGCERVVQLKGTIVISVYDNMYEKFEESLRKLCDSYHL